MNNIDPYNNAPPPREGKGGCSTGSCGAKPSMTEQYTGPPGPQQQIPQYAGRTTEMSQRPMGTPGRPDLQTENQMLHADLQVAIQYIHHLGGQWPPPGQ